MIPMLEDFQSSPSESDLERLRHSLMRAYGWIPEDEFYNKTSIDDVLKMMNQMKIEQDQTEREMKRGKR